MLVTSSNRRSTSCPPGSPKPPTLRRAHSSNDLTSALHLIGLVDKNVVDNKDSIKMKAAATTALSQPTSNAPGSAPRKDLSRPRHARKFSMQKRKKSISSIIERPELRTKRARSSHTIDKASHGNYSGCRAIKRLRQSLDLRNRGVIIDMTALSSMESITDTGSAKPDDGLRAAHAPYLLSAVPRSPSCIGLLEADEGHPAGYESLGSVSAAVSPTTMHADDPAAMYLEQAQKLDRRLRGEAMKLGATAVGNSTIISVEDSGAMQASGIALIITSPPAS